MDDFVLSNLHESKNEWCGRLISILTPLTIEGIYSIFDESWNMCMDNNEIAKYLMTFQNMLARVPKWNSLIIEEESKRIIERSGCKYLEDLISCVHIIQLKVLTCIRVGNKQKKIDISIPKLDSFIHRVYVHIARKVYGNVYLFEKNIADLQTQKNKRELEIMVQECIMTSIRESIPTESIIRAYLDETVEEEEEVFLEEIIEDKPELSQTQTVTKEDIIKTEPDLPPILSVENMNEEKIVTRLSFNDIDEASDGTQNIVLKDVENLEQISRNKEEENEKMPERIKIHMNDDIQLNDVFDLDKTQSSESAELSDIEDL
jgi:hypothetical protein